ncbi:MAG: DUF2294 domain-containing protein [Bacillota bacterium]|nr:DUF2294 domain-containing protein [Bacillota bacterium]
MERVHLLNGVGKLEAAIAEAVTKFHRGLFGKGPESARAYVLGDMVIVRLRGVLTTEEQHLVKTEKGRQVVKMMRQVLRESYANDLEAIIANLTGCSVLSSHSDISTKTGERVEVFILDRHLPASH